MTTRKSEPGSTDGSHSPPAEVVRLKELAEARARRLGHAPGCWDKQGDDGAEGWRTTCERCGAVAYVRYERGLLGLAGALCTQNCSTSKLEHA
jgi:hypothetical protein